jgi:putative membrane protein
MVGIIKASTLFSTKDRDTIEHAIIDAEKQTSGEIIPVIASVSGRYDRAEDIFGLIFSLICVSWSSFNFDLTSILLTILFSFIIGVLLTHFFPFLRLPFIAKSETAEEVDRAAAAAFQQHRLRNTKDSTGILIYISLYEHQVRVLGDDAISAKLSHADWSQICETIVNGFKQKQYTHGIVDGIKLAGQLLAQHFPIKEEDTNELANELIIID